MRSNGVGAAWKYDFWHARHVRGNDIIRVHGEGPAGWIAYLRCGELYLIGYEMTESAVYGVSTRLIRKLSPAAEILEPSQAVPLIEEISAALKGVQLI